MKPGIFWSTDVIPLNVLYGVCLCNKSKVHGVQSVIFASETSWFCQGGSLVISDITCLRVTLYSICLVNFTNVLHVIT
jgi:hypothetical protein